MFAIDFSHDVLGDEADRLRFLNPRLLEAAHSLSESFEMTLHVVQASQIENENFMQIHGGIAGLLIGNTAEELLRVADCSILSLKPPGFVSPVQPD